ncbi:MAG TPA: hypothetical protein VF885_04240 [Arthrobacter sp.]
MRTLDRNYLATHPAGDDLAAFNISLSIPASVDVPNNPDGTRPQISLKATSDTYGNLLGVLSYVHDMDINELAMAILLENVDEEKLEAFDSAEAAAPFMREAAAEIITPFRTFTLGFALEADGVDLPVGADLELTGPSMVSAAQALKSMTRPFVLSDLAISFSPEIDDEDDDYSDGSRNEVLVVS